MRVLLAGASGFLGTALRERLTADGHETRQLVRREPSANDEIRWSPERGELPEAALDGVDAVVNLSGAALARWPWTSSYKETIRDSRVQPTSTLAKALAERDEPIVLVNGSAVGVYGEGRGDEELSESTPPGDGFLAAVVQAWESATEPASAAGRRVVLLRTAPVLAASGGVLKIMSRPFRLGVGGRLGDGRQWFPSISLDDWLAVVLQASTDDSMSGTYNAVAPVPATNAELTKLLGNLLQRPTIMPVPAFALRTVLGEVSGQLLESLKVRPARLLEMEFDFAHPDLESQLRAALQAGSER